MSAVALLRRTRPSDRHRRRPGRKHLPLWHLPADPRPCTAPRAQQAGAAMSPLGRRELLRSSLVSGRAGDRLPRSRKRGLPASSEGPPDPNAFVRVAPDGIVTVLLATRRWPGHLDGLAMMIARSWTATGRSRVEHAPPRRSTRTCLRHADDRRLEHTWSEFERYRTVGAMAREMLVRARRRSGGRPEEAQHRQRIRHRRQAKLSYGDLRWQRRRSSLPRRDAQGQEDWKILGKPTRRLDSPEKINARRSSHRRPVRGLRTP